jgi:hypothetical protein
MRTSTFLAASGRVALALVLCAVALQPAPAALADDRPVRFQYDEPGYSVRIYEVFQRGPKLFMEVRTSRMMEPDVIRDLKVGEVRPPEGEEPLKVGRSRGHLEYFASYWRDDLSYDRGGHEVEVWEVAESGEPGVSLVRVRLVERPEDGGMTGGAFGGRGMAATAATGKGPLFGARLYEVYQKGASLVLQERTTRAFGPEHARGVHLGETWPPADGPALEVWKNRDHLAFLGSYWQQGGHADFTSHEVEVWEDGEPRQPGSALVRMRILPRGARETGAPHFYKNPYRAERRRAEGR